MKVGFFTSRSLSPLHPRLVLFNQYLKSRGWEATFINNSHHDSSWLSRLNWLSLWFFDLVAIQKSKEVVKDFDIIIINDLRYLPLAKPAFKSGKIVIYDTIDFNVHLRFYQLEKKIPLIRVLKKLIVSTVTRMELRYAKHYTHAITVNSKALADYFGPQALTLYYTSPFESMEVTNNPQLSPALLYLGAFTNEKGAQDVLTIQQKLNVPLFIFGKTSSAIRHQLQNREQVFFTENLSVEKLQERLKELLSSYFLMGFSLIKPVHYSYEVQEANKDIDYLALGMPIIGNYRGPTKTKIKAGCGIFFDDTLLNDKLSNPEWRKKSVNECLHHYQSQYAVEIFYGKLNSLFDSLGFTRQSS